MFTVKGVTGIREQSRKDISVMAKIIFKKLAPHIKPSLFYFYMWVPTHLHTCMLPGTETQMWLFMNFHLIYPLI